MRHSTPSSQRRTTLPQRAWCGGAVAAALCILLCAGCPDAGNGNDNDNGNTGDTLAAVIKNITADIRVSGDQDLTIIYDATPADAVVAAFYLPVESSSPDAPAVGAEVTFASNLPGGLNRTTTLITGTMALGVYKVGLNLTLNDQTLKVYATGTVEITTLPTPVFELPNQNLAVTPGAPIAIRALLGDPENAVQWRLFYLADSTPTAGVPADELGNLIAVGTANVAETQWNTAGVPFGSYRIGIFVTDSGLSIAQTVATGNSDQILGPVFCDFTVTLTETPPEPVPPTLTVSQPASNQSIIVFDETDPTDGNVQIAYSATVFQGPPSLQKIDVFYDFDGIADSGDEQPISSNLPVTATNAVFRVASIAVGQTANIGVTVDDGVTDPVTRYANGRITRLDPDDATLTVTQPSSPLPRKPGETVNVAWQINNLPSDTSAETFVYFRQLNSTGTPVDSLPNSDPINTTGLPLSQSSYGFVATTAGRYRVTVQVVFANDQLEPLEADAPNPVTVASLPKIFWLGSLAPGDPFDASVDYFPSDLDGAIFEAVQFEDNAGSAFAGNEDFDGDGLDECIIAARYAKPNFVNPSGVGPGEAYLIRGRETRYNGIFNLNSVSSSTIPGLTFTGIDVRSTIPYTNNPNASADDTDGLATLFITSGGNADGDGDGIGEIVFGFPWTRSGVIGDAGGPAPVGVDDSGNPVEFCPVGGLARDADGWEIPQFFRGGAVLYSSQNEALQSKFNDQSGEDFALDFVGQAFSTAQVQPEPSEGTLCGNNCSWLEDDLGWVSEGECPTGDAGGGGYVGCDVREADGDQDSLIRPQAPPREPGFSYRLADPFICYAFYDGRLIACNQRAAESGCPASDDTCDSEAGAGNCDSDPLTLDIPNCSPTRELFEAGTGQPACDPPTPDTCDQQKRNAENSLPIEMINIGSSHEPAPLGTGVYPDRVSTESYNLPAGNTYGARLIGTSNFDALGTFITQSDNDLILASAFASGTSNRGIGFMALLGQYWDLPGTNGDANLGAFNKPHQLNIDAALASGARSKWIVGDQEELIQNIVAIPDFNRDNRTDIAVGAPLADVDGDGTIDGAVYIVFRRAPALEADFWLVNLKLATNDPERLSGVLLHEASGEGQRFGQSIAGDFDFNHDGYPDVAIGNPDGNNGTGEVIIVFSNNNLISQGLGIPIEDEGGVAGLLTRGGGLRITGVELASEFGLSVVNVGDLDGDGMNDMAIAAPNAAPMFDGDPNDTVEILDTPGLDGVRDNDLDGVVDAPDGIADDVSGPRGFPDGKIDANDQLRRAGLVYIILSTSFEMTFEDNPFARVDVSIAELGTLDLDGYIVVGRRGERYAADDPTGVNPPLHEGDFLGGGDSGLDSERILFGRTITYGGNPAKGPKPILDASGSPRALVDGTPLVRQRGLAIGIGRAGDIDGDGREDLLLGAQLADPRVDPETGFGTRNGGEAYLIYGFGQ